MFALLVALRNDRTARRMWDQWFQPERTLTKDYEITALVSKKKGVVRSAYFFFLLQSWAAPYALFFNVDCSLA